jgi:hypothetical protein
VANQSRQAIILWNPASGTVTRNITAPAQSKIYTVINASGGTQSIVFRGAGPTTGVTIVKGESAVVAWNGTDFIKISNAGGAASFTNVTVSGTTTLSGLTASTALALDASKNVVSVTNTGTGNNVLSASPTLTGTVGAAALTLSSDLTLNGGSANGVAFLNASKVLTTGSALTFDGTNFSSTGTTTVNSANSTQVALVVKGETGNGIRQNFIGQASSGQYNWQIGASITAAGNFSIIPSTAVDGATFSTAAYSITGTGTSIWAVSGSEQMRLTSTGLGIGTSSPGFKLDVASTVDADLFRIISTATANNTVLRLGLSGNNAVISASGGATGTMQFNVYGSERMRLDSSGNLGIGTSSPAFKLDVNGAVQATDYRAPTSSTFFLTGDNFRWRGTGGTELMRLDGSGNLGLGVTPSAWSPGKAIEVGFAGSGVYSYSQTDTELLSNAYYNAGYKYGGTGRAMMYGMGTAGAGIHAWYTAPSGTAGNAISFTQAMTLDASGNLGVGTTSPSSFDSVADNLVVGTTSGNNGITIAAGTTGASTINFADGTSGGAQYAGYIDYQHNGDFMRFGTNGGTERARITSGGDLLVGTTSQLFPASQARLNVDSGDVGTATFKTSGGSAQATLYAFNSATTGDNAFISFGTEATWTARGGITYNRAGGLVVYGTTSDYRSKDIIGPMVDSGAVIDATPVYMGKMKGATQERPMFIAHETPAYAHTGEKDAVDADGNPVYQQMDASALIPVMWAEIQSLRQRLAAAGI